MCWIKYVVCFISEFSAARICGLSLDKRKVHSSRSVAMKQTDRRALGTECQGCGKLFSTQFAYDQHRRSPFLHATPCYALPNENRVNVTAVPRPNMSTAALDRRPAKRVRCNWHILHILHIYLKSQIGPYPVGKALSEISKQLYFTYFQKN